MGNRFKRKVLKSKQKQSEAKRALEMVMNACQWLEGFGQEVNDRVSATMLVSELIFDHLGWSQDEVKEKLKAKKAEYDERRKVAEAAELAKQAEQEAKRLENMTEQEKAAAALDREIAEHNAKVERDEAAANQVDSANPVAV